MLFRSPALMHRAQRKLKRKRQVLVSTHSADLLSDKGIGPEEVLLLAPDREGTKVQAAIELQDVVALLKNGMSVGEAILPKTRPRNINQLLMEWA